MEEISHRGRIVSIGNTVTEVEIIQTSACAGCHARNLCGYSEQQTKVVTVPTDGFAMHAVGDEVDLRMKQSMGMKAVWISYVVPLLVLIIAVLASSAFGMPELFVGLTGIACVAVYYFIVFLLREKLNNQFVFYIKD